MLNYVKKHLICDFCFNFWALPTEIMSYFRSLGFPHQILIDFSFFFILFMCCIEVFYFISSICLSLLERGDIILISGFSTLFRCWVNSLQCILFCWWRFLFDRFMKRLIIFLVGLCLFSASLIEPILNLFVATNYRVLDFISVH